MTGLCGWFTLDGATAHGAIEAREPTLHAPSGASLAHLENPLGACLVRGGWIAGDEDGRIAAIAGHPFWRDAGLSALAGSRDPAQALLDAYRRLGDGLFARIAGDFALAILDPVGRRLLAGIDRTGQVPLHFARIEGGVVFGTTADSVLDHPGMDRNPTAAGLHHYLFFHMLPAPVSLFAGVEKLQAGQLLHSDRSATRVAPYWLPSFEEPYGADPVSLRRKLHDLIGDSVRRLAQTERPGAFLSGGLDSSTVAGMLAGLRPGAADSFSIGFEAEGYDEMAYARIAAGHFGTRAHEYYVTPDDVVAAVPLIAASYDEPFGNSSALPAYFCARLAAETGVTRLLGGDGGDELFAGNERYAKQGIFERWGRIPGLARRGLIEPVLMRLPQAIPLAGKVRSYIEQARIPLPDRLQTYNFLHRMALEEMFDPGFLADIDTQAPWELMRDIYQRPEGASSLNRMMYLDWQQTLADNDLRKVTRMCHLAGVDVAFPMLDDALVEFSCRVPSAMKLHRGRLRHFYKEAMQGFLPDAIIHKKKQGFGLPFGVWMQSHAPLRELAYESLKRLDRRGYFREGFLEQAMRLHQSGHAAYYGELIWILMMLELWLDAHSAGAGKP